MRGGWQGQGRKDGARDLDLYSAIVVPSSTGAVSHTLNNQLLSSHPSRAQPSFSSTKAADPSSGIAKEQTRGRIYCSYCNVDESPAEFRDVAVYFRRSDHTVSICIYIFRNMYHVERYCAFFSREIRKPGYIVRTMVNTCKKDSWSVCFPFSQRGQDRCRTEIWPMRIYLDVEQHSRWKQAIIPRSMVLVSRQRFHSFQKPPDGVSSLSISRWWHLCRRQRGFLFDRLS